MVREETFQVRKKARLCGRIRMTEALDGIRLTLAPEC